MCELTQTLRSANIISQPHVCVGPEQACGRRLRGTARERLALSCVYALAEKTRERGMTKERVKEKRAAALQREEEGGRTGPLTMTPHCRCSPVDTRPGVCLILVLF